MNSAVKDRNGSSACLVKPETALILTSLNNILTELDVKAYVVGGFVRDMLLERQTADIDIALAADALEVAPKVANALGGRFVLLDKVNRVGRVVLTGGETAPAGGYWQLDFATFEGNIESDLMRRDFTLDAMAVDLGRIVNQPGRFSKDNKTISAEIIDPFNGWDDLCHGVVRVLADATFRDDAVRLLRAVRLSAELGFRLDNTTEALIKRDHHLIGSIAGERIREELLRLLAIPQTGAIMYYLDELGLLTAIIPVLAEAKDVVQPKEHFWDVFQHSLETVAAVDFLLRKGNLAYAGDEILATVPWSPVLAQHFDLAVSHGSNRRMLLKLAALLHDIAKPRTKSVDAAGRMRFLGHAGEGAAVVVDIMEKLRFSAREVKLAALLVEHHLRPGQLSRDGLPSRRAIYRYFRDTGEAGIDVIFLNLADFLAARGPNLNPAPWQEHCRVVAHVMDQRFQEANLVAPPKLISGHDLINTLGMNPGPGMGEALEAVREAQATGEVVTREEALAYIREYLINRAV